MYAAFLLIGVYAARIVKDGTLADLLVAGRAMPFWMAALTMTATWVDGDVGRRRLSARHGRRHIPIKRRTFLTTSALALAAPTILPASVFRANAPSNRITIRCYRLAQTERRHPFAQTNGCLFLFIRVML